MEWHWIVDFGLDSETHQLWARLDGNPSSVWLSYAFESLPEHQTDVPLKLGGSRLPRPISIGPRLSMSAGVVDEIDAFTLLTAHVHAANAALADHRPMDRPSRRRL